jgi:hypothetical protein
MSTTRSFSAMLNEYLPNDLMREELIKRDWLLSNVEIDDSWKGGKLIVPFEGAHASSLKFGSLTSSTDVSEYSYQRGSVDDYVEVWGTLKFNHRDLMEHDGKVNEKSFLKILPGQIDQYMQYMKEAVSMNMLNGAVLATPTGEANSNIGVYVVDKIDRFVLGQKVTLDDGNSNQEDAYVIGINLNTSEVTFSDTRGGNFKDYSAIFTIAQSMKIYHDGVLVAGTVTNTFSSLKLSLLSAANGGSASLYGKTKVAYPYLQAINVDGSAVSASNVLDKIFDAYSTVRQKARGNARTVVMSYKHLGSCMKLIETQKGAFKTTATATKASLYGWTEISITSVKGELTIVGVQELDNDVILLMDMSAVKFYSNGMFKKRTAPDGKQYFEVRDTTGYSYLLDMCLFGELVLLAPSKCGIIYSIPNY